MRINTLAALVLALSSVEARQRILVYTKTLRFRHDSIPNAIAAVTELGAATSPGWDTVATEDEAPYFTTRASLNQFDALVFISTTGEVLSPAAADNMRLYLQDGGSYVGIHAASDCLTNTPWYGRVVGAYFRTHPPLCNARLDVADKSHPSVSFLQNGTWDIFDEIYTMNSNPRDLNHTVLLTVEDGSYPDPVTPADVRADLMGTPHPLAWYKDGSAQPPGDGILDAPFRPAGGGMDNAANQTGQSGVGGRGRTWYTTLGHLPETYADPTYRAHIAGGLRWALDSSSLRSVTRNDSSPGQPSKDGGAPTSTTTRTLASGTQPASSSTATVSALASGSTPTAPSSGGTGEAGRRVGLPTAGSGVVLCSSALVAAMLAFAFV